MTEEFSKEIMDCVYRLRDKYRKRKHCVVVHYPVIELIIYENKKETSTKLIYSPSTNMFEMQGADTRAYSKISYFDYDIKERRLVRNQDLMFMIVHDLQHCGLWEFVSNRDLIVVNQFNKRIDFSKRKKLLKAMLMDD